MAGKLTTEQKEARRIAKEARDAEDAKAAEAQRLRRIEELAIYKASIPKRLMDAQAAARWLGISTDVSLTASGPLVNFNDDSGNIYINETLTYESEEWELESLEQTLKNLKEKRDAYEAQRIVAQDAWSSQLTTEQQLAIREHFHYLR